MSDSETDGTAGTESTATDEIEATFALYSTLGDQYATVQREVRADRFDTESGDGSIDVLLRWEIPADEATEMNVSQKIVSVGATIAETLGIDDPEIERVREDSHVRVDFRMSHPIEVGGSTA